MHTSTHLVLSVSVVMRTIVRSGLVHSMFYISSRTPTRDMLMGWELETSLKTALPAREPRCEQQPRAPRPFRGFGDGHERRPRDLLCNAMQYVARVRSKALSRESATCNQALLTTCLAMAESRGRYRRLGLRA